MALRLASSVWELTEILQSHPFNYIIMSFSNLYIFRPPQSLGSAMSPPTYDPDSKEVTLTYDHGEPCTSDPSLNTSSVIVFKCKNGLDLVIRLIVIDIGSRSLWVCFIFIAIGREKQWAIIRNRHFRFIFITLTWNGVGKFLMLLIAIRSSVVIIFPRMYLS